MAPLHDLLAALELLTRLPVGRVSRRSGPPDLSRIVWAYPLAGALSGGLGGLAYWLAAALGCPPAIAAIWCLGALVLVTGALHEDGLADMADGLGGGATRERKLEIMRDSRTGSYGAVALALSLGLRGASIAVLAEPGLVAASLAAAGAAGRGGIVGLQLLLEPARTDGLAAAGGRPAPAPAAIGLGLAAVLTLGFAPAGTGLLALSAGAAACLAVAALARRQIGGHTGDVLGAGEQAVECLVLTVLVAAL